MAELFAGILQHHGRATVVGTRTYGKSSVQRFNPLPRDGRAELCDVATCALPDGRQPPIEPDHSGGIDEAIAALARLG